MLSKTEEEMITELKAISEAISNNTFALSAKESARNAFIAMNDDLERYLLVLAYDKNKLSSEVRESIAETHKLFTTSYTNDEEFISALTKYQNFAQERINQPRPKERLLGMMIAISFVGFISMLCASVFVSLLFFIPAAIFFFIGVVALCNKTDNALIADRMHECSQKGLQFFQTPNDDKQDTKVAKNDGHSPASNHESAWLFQNQL